MNNQDAYQIKFKFYQPIYLLAKDKDKLQFTVKFDFERMKVSMEMLGEAQIYEIPDGDLKGFCFRDVSCFDFVCQIDKTNTRLTNLIAGTDSGDAVITLYKLLVRIINRVLSAIRISGQCPEVKLVPLELEYAKYSLDIWEVKIKAPEAEWKTLVEEAEDSLSSPPFGGSLFRSVRQTAMLRPESYRDIKESIEDEKTVFPEQEIEVNVIEHKREKDYRLAVLESIIAFEMTVNVYLRSLMNSREIGSEKISNFIGNTTLSSKIEILKLLLPAHIRQAVDFGSIGGVNSWRNKIVHDYGKLPDTISEKDIQEKLEAVSSLTRTLRYEQVKIVSEPFLQNISDSLRQKFGVTCWLDTLGTRKFLLTVAPFFGKEITESGFGEIVADCIVRLKEHSDRFIPNEDFLAKMSRILDGKARMWWVNGRIEKEQSAS